MNHKRSTLRRLGTAVLLAIVTACATSSGTDDMDATDDAVQDAKKPNYDTSTKDKASMCTSCNIDTDCQSSCGAPPDGMNWCCDTSMNSCYPATQCSNNNNDGGGAG